MPLCFPHLDCAWLADRLSPDNPLAARADDKRVLATPSPQLTEATVVRVIDGDTIEVDIGGRLYKVRYSGIDTPEVGQPGAEEATAFNAQLVSGKTVYLEKDVSETDRYGRLLRYVWTEEGMVNAILVANGYAQVSTYPPDVK
ncbi:MAG: thermonuclease family protein [Chloroflexi bacterium]|nr:thermonuclease family protein [Chloroflexota bacterium]